MTPQEKRRERDHAIAVALYVRKQQREQTGTQEKWNANVATGDDDVIWLDVMQPED